jgi:hypothetical protein
VPTTRWRGQAELVGNFGDNCRIPCGSSVVRSRRETCDFHHLHRRTETGSQTQGAHENCEIPTLRFTRVLLVVMGIFGRKGSE